MSGDQRAGGIYIEVDVRDEATRALRDVGQAAERAADRTRQLVRQMDAVGTGLTVIGGTGVAGFTAAANAAIEFESSFADIIKVVAASDAELLALRDTILEMATAADNPLSGLADAQNVLAGIAAQGGQLGIAVDDLDEFTQAVGELALATNLSAESAGVISARFLNLADVPISEIGSFAGAIVDLGNNFAAYEDEIANTALRTVAAGSAAGQSADEILAFSTTLAASGISAELAGSNYSQLLSRITSMVATGAPELWTLAEIAQQSNAAFTEAWETDPTYALMTFLNGLRNMDTSAQVVAMESLGFTGAEMQRVLMTLGSEFDTLQEALAISAEGWDAATAATEEAGARFNTTEGQIERAKNAVRDLGIKVGNALLPVIRDAADRTADFAGELADFASKNPETVRIVAALAGGALALGIALKAAAVAAGIFGPLIAAITSPIGLAAIAIGAAAGAAVWLGEQLLKLPGVADWIVQRYGEFSVTLTGIIDDISSAVAGLPDTIERTIAAVGAAAREMGNQFIAGLRPAIDIINDLIEGINRVTGANIGTIDLPTARPGIGTAMGRGSIIIPPTAGRGGGVVGSGASGNTLTIAPGFASGTHWTGDGSGIAGVVHSREAVIPAEGMRVYPDPAGLQLRGGGGGSASIIIQNLTVMANDIGALARQLDEYRRQQGVRA